MNRRHTIINTTERVSLNGKFFRIGSSRFTVKGVAYGPFAADSNGDRFGSRDTARRDFERILDLGANTLRVYHVPPGWFLDLANEHRLQLLIDIPWNKHVCFLDRPEWAEQAVQTVRDGARRCAAHPAVFGLSVVNEIPSDIVRWTGARAVSDFIDALIGEVKALAPDCLCTFGNYPPTEFLRPRAIDFHCFNVYLHQESAFSNYLARLQMLAESKPLVLGEFGMDTIREGKERVTRHLGRQIELTFRAGLAGCLVFSYTDDWERGGGPVRDWAFGLTTRDRQPRRSFAAVRNAFSGAPYFRPTAVPAPRVTVVIAAFNAARTLETCLRSVSELNYLDYEILLVDDGSTDETPEIAARHPRVKCLRHPKNLGLSVARNTGIFSATGDIVAFTDADCRPDPDWLHYLIGDLLNGRFVGIGGHNLLPSDDSAVASVVMVSPGGPAHVMLTDQLAEHVPGCNMAFYKWALVEIGGFDPVFKRAGDDVDVCWRLQQRGYRIGFSPAGFVWHYRRSTVRDYLEQQRGYGEAEALLVRKHPEYFNRFGGNIWHGRIYSAAKTGIVTRASRIYHGQFGTGLFQTLYAPSPNIPLMLCTSFEYHALVTLPLLVIASVFRVLLPLGLASLTLSLTLCVVAAAQADIPRRPRKIWSRPLAALLFALQPVWRGWARHRASLRGQAAPSAPFPARTPTDEAGTFETDNRQGTVILWDKHGRDRPELLREIIRGLERSGWQYRMDGGWNRHDLEIYGSRWSRSTLRTVAEDHGHRRRLFRCRLQTGWTFLARTTFWSMLGLQVIVLGFAARTLPALWVSLISMPLFWFWMARDQSRLKRVLSAFVAETGHRLGMKRSSASGPPQSDG